MQRKADRGTETDRSVRCGNELGRSAISAVGDVTPPRRSRHLPSKHLHRHFATYHYTLIRYYVLGKITFNLARRWERTTHNT